MTQNKQAKNANPKGIPKICLYLSILLIGIFFSAFIQHYPNNPIFLNDFYSKDLNGVYYKGKLVINADPATFIVESSEFFGKDKNNIYYKTEIVPNIDANSFFALNQWIFYDNNGVYLYLSKLKDKDKVKKIDLIDRKTMDYMSPHLLRDSQNVYHVLNKNIDIIENIDPNTVKIINSNLFHNDKGIYTAGLRTPTSLKDEPHHETIDPKSIEILGSNYFKGNGKVFIAEKSSKGGVDLFYKEVKNADPETFLVLNKNYAKDKSGIYYRDSKMLADPLTFVEINNSYGKDEESVFFHGQKIVKSDSKTFETLEYPFSKDKNYYFFEDKISPVTLKKIHPTKNKYDNLNEFFIGTDNYIYFTRRLLETDRKNHFDHYPKVFPEDFRRLDWIDAESFKVLDQGHRFSDKNGIYRNKNYQIIENTNYYTGFEVIAEKCFTEKCNFNLKKGISLNEEVTTLNWKNEKKKKITNNIKEIFLDELLTKIRKDSFREKYGFQDNFTDDQIYKLVSELVDKNIHIETHKPQLFRKNIDPFSGRSGDYIDKLRKEYNNKTLQN